MNSSQQRLEFLARSLRPLVVTVIPGQQRTFNKLKAARIRLSNELAEVINEFGPKLYEDFNEVCAITQPIVGTGDTDLLKFRIMVPSASAPPSTGSPGLWRRKSSTGAVDAQGNLLVHPMVS